MRKVKKEIEGLAGSQGEKVKVVWPYEFVTQSEIDQLGAQAKFEIFSRCKSHLDNADLLVALLDGSMVDDGTAWEVGYYYRGKPKGAKVIGIRTDSWNAGESTGAVVNAMVECACDRIARSSEELMEILFEIFGKGQ